ncbi:MAG: hypothetical protein EB084_24985, partial [Proteobacteria bacterium]|nr:hypothetical protein [Pseudomonadota bacterium]
MQALAACARALIPLTLPLTSSLLRKDARRTAHPLYPPLAFEGLAIAALLLVGFAWAVGDASISHDFAYVILVALFAASSYFSLHAGRERQSAILSMGLFTIT